MSTPADEWVSLLAAAARQSSQARIAKRLGVSPAMINQALKGRYKGDIERLRQRVLGEFGGLTVACPVLGEINRNQCIRYQSRPFAATNAARVRLYRACHGGCPHSFETDQHNNKDEIHD